MNKLTLPATIIIASIIIGGFYYASQLNKQKSIEKQQQIELVAKTTAENTEAEFEKKEYVAKRKIDCFGIYDKEKSNWSNVLRPEYDEDMDVCRIIYKANKGEWANIKCETQLPMETTPPESNIYHYLMRQYSLCMENAFDREF
jgi:Na+-transporting NADH:ubiquinone oxidoreductase subunit NqrC